MSQALVRPASPGGAGLIRYVCTKNPFYAISAALVLLGLWVSFGNQTEETEVWSLMGGLAGYTLLLAATACMLVRFLACWDDARTVLLLVVLLFLATSVTFDHVLVMEPTLGTWCYVLGLVLSILVSEGVLRGIRLRLPALYRLPYYFLLGLFFLYPLFVRALLDRDQPISEPHLWALFGFSTAAGLVFLTLLPALRAGPGYLARNGSPWPWPLYPWSLFGMLAIAVPGRAILMCWSLHELGANAYDRLIFGPYFLVPFGLALTILLLEMGLVSHRENVCRWALLMPICLVILAAVGHEPGDPVYRVLRVLTTPLGDHEAFGPVRLDPDPVYAEFLRLFSARLGADPLFLTLALVGCFYGYAALRGVPLAIEATAVSLGAFAMVATDTLSTGLMLPPLPWPLLAPAAIELTLGWRRRDPWDLLVGLACLMGVIALAVPLAEPLDVGSFRGRVFMDLVVLAMLAVGAVFHDLHGHVIRCVAASVVLLLSFAAMYGNLPFPEWTLPAGPIVYSLLLGVLLAAYGHLLRHSYSVVIATIILGYWLFKYAWTLYRSTRSSLAGFDYLASGLGFFAVAVLVSLAKCGRLTQWLERRFRPMPWRRPIPALVPAEPPSPPSADAGEGRAKADRPSLELGCAELTVLGILDL
jgi:hypothetical protein